MGVFSRGQRPDADELRTTPLFASLTDDQLGEVARMAQRREVAAGDVIIEQGRFGDAFFVISSGRANVYMNDTYVASVGEGSAVGEMALVERRPRNATVVAEEAMVLAEFSLEKFRDLLERFPTAGLRVHELLNTRLRENETRD